jgi:DNA-binding response OmpR family regulator
MSKIKVLVIDDERILRHLIQTTFGSHEYDMQIAHQQQDLADIQHFQPDILILNLSQRNSHDLLTDSERHLVDRFHCDHLEVDFTKRAVYCSSERVHLTPTEYDLLKCFVQNQGKALSHEDLLAAVRQDGRAYSTHLIRVHVSNLRRKIETDTSDPHIQTIPGIGYRFVGCQE